MRCYKDDTITVPKHLEINMDKLKSYLNWALKLHSKGKQNCLQERTCLPLS